MENPLFARYSVQSVIRSTFTFFIVHYDLFYPSKMLHNINNSAPSNEILFPERRAHVSLPYPWICIHLFSNILVHDISSNVRYEFVFTIVWIDAFHLHNSMDIPVSLTQ